MNLNNNNGADNNEQPTFHGEVEDRLKWWAEKHSKTTEEARMSSPLTCCPTSVSVTIRMKMMTLNRSRRIIHGRTPCHEASSANATELIGYFVGVDTK